MTSNRHCWTLSHGAWRHVRHTGKMKFTMKCSIFLYNSLSKLDQTKPTRLFAGGKPPCTLASW